MNKQKVQSRLSLIGGILIVLVGVAHTLGIPSVYRNFQAIFVDPHDGGSLTVLAATYLFAVLGLYILFSGWLLIYTSGGLARSERWAWTVASTTAICNLVAGTGVLVVGVRSPFVVTWVVTSLVLVLLSCFSFGSYSKAN
jgi:hypothetical protein